MFTPQQKAELWKSSLSRVVCDNSDISEVPPDAFRFGKYPSGFVSCDHLPSMNLEAWREEKSRGGPIVPTACSSTHASLESNVINTRLLFP